MKYKSLAEIFSRLIEIVGEQSNERYGVVGKVKNIDTTKMQCDVEPINGDSDIIGVKFACAQNQDTGFIVIPKTGSEVTVLFENPNYGSIVHVKEIDEIRVTGNKITIDLTGNFEVSTTLGNHEIEAKQFKFKGTSTTLKAIWTETLTNLQALTVSTAFGPSSVPVNAANFALTLTTKVNTFFT